MGIKWKVVHQDGRGWTREEIKNWMRSKKGIYNFEIQEVFLNQLGDELLFRGTNGTHYPMWVGDNDMFVSYDD